MQGTDHADRQTRQDRPARFEHSFEQISLFPPEQQNDTGLPGTLKAGIENLSGLIMDNVRVHYNSSKPAQVRALAYTLGPDIHVGPGQEKHLPHEAWHVVQQKQGRVKPTLQAKGMAINDDEELEREADVMGARAIWEPEAVQMKRNEGGLSPFPGGRPVLQGYFSAGLGTHPAPHMEVEAAWEYVKANRPDALETFELMMDAQAPYNLQDWLADELNVYMNEIYDWEDSLRDDRTAIESLSYDRAVSTDPRQESPTALWGIYTAALLRDLQNLQKVSPELLNRPVIRDRLVRAITSVLLYKSHVAAFQSLDPVLGGDSNPRLRQESPWDRNNPEVYYRSQRDGHPQIDLYREGIRYVRSQKGVKEYSTKKLLAPYNRDVREFVQKSTPSGTEFKKNIKVRNIQGLTIVQKGHSELSAAYVGLRQTNPEAIAEMVRYFLDQKNGLTLLIQFIQKKAKDFGIDLPKVGPASTLQLEEIWKIFDDVMAALSSVDEVRGQEHTTTSPESSQSEAEDPNLSDSYVTRKLGQTTERARKLASRLSGLKRLKVKLQADNPQITIELAQFPEEKNFEDVQTDYEPLVEALRIYLAVAITRRATLAGLPLSAGMRQSFGFLDTTLANTGPSIRLSLGTEPAEYLQILEEAIKTVDTELDMLVQQAKTPKDLEKIFGREDNRMRLRTLGRPQSPNGLIAYFQALKSDHTLANHLDFVTHKLFQGQGLEDDESSNKWEMVKKLAIEANQELVKRQEKGFSSKDVTSSEGNTAYGRQMPILEPLSNLLLMAADVITNLSFEMAGSRLFATTRRQALDELVLQIHSLREMVGQLTNANGPLRVRIHSALRNAAEDICESLLILLASQERIQASPTETKAHAQLTSSELLTPGQQSALTALNRGTQRRNAAEPRIQNYLISRLGKDMNISVFRTDSGEQAGTTTFAALNAEQTKQGGKFVAEVDNERTYYELARHFFSENKINIVPQHDENTPDRIDATFLDPRPYIKNVEEGVGTSPDAFRVRIKTILSQLDKRGKDETPFTIVIDATNIDYTHPQIVEVIQSALDKIKSNRVRFVLITSGVKHEQIGLDKYQVGRIIVIGSPVEGLKSFSANPLVNQLLHLLEDLRDVDRSAAEELATLLPEIKRDPSSTSDPKDSSGSPFLPSVPKASSVLAPAREISTPDPSSFLAPEELSRIWQPDALNKIFRGQDGMNYRLKSHDQGFFRFQHIE